MSSKQKKTRTLCWRLRSGPYSADWFGETMTSSSKSGNSTSYDRCCSRLAVSCLLEKTTFSVLSRRQQGGELPSTARSKESPGSLLLSQGTLRLQSTAKTSVLGL